MSLEFALGFSWVQAMALKNFYLLFLKMPLENDLLTRLDFVPWAIAIRAPLGEYATTAESENSVAEGARDLASDSFDHAHGLDANDRFIFWWYVIAWTQAFIG